MKKNLLLLPLLVCMFINSDVNAQSVAVTKTNSTKVYIHYMPWFTAPRNPGTGVTNFAQGVTASGSWGFHWCNDGSKANPNTFTTVTDYTGTSVQARNVDAHYHPLIGPYDGSDPDVIEYHLLLMKLSGVDGVLIDWYGQGGQGAPDAAPLLINSNALIAATGGVGLKYGLVMEDAAWATLAAAQSNGSYAVNNYFNNSLYPGSTYITLGDMRGSSAANASAPLVCVFGPQTYKTQGQWSSILGSANTKAFLPLYNQAAQIGTDAGGTFMWPDPQGGQGGTPPGWYSNTSNYYTGGATTLHNTSKENGTTLGDNVALGTAYQGFFDFYLPNAASTSADQYGVIPRNYNGNTLSATLALYNSHKSVMDGLQIATWNDYSEGTMIEPTVEFGFASLDTIQKFTGVSYTEADLLQVYRLFTLRKLYTGNTNIQSELNQVFTYFTQLDIANAKSLMDCIVNTGGTNCTTLPSITSATKDTVVAGSALSYQIVATTTNGAIIRYGASNLPAGFTINTSTGVISGSSYAVGSYAIIDSATNASGTTYNSLTLTISQPSTELPYNGTVTNVPGIIQGENYDLGGQGLAYNDADASNQGGQYRTNEGVDIETTSDAGGGYDVGYINAGEWIQYTINVTQTGTYNVTARVASGIAGNKTFDLTLDGSTIGTITVPPTGGWQTWQTTAGITTTTLSAGQHVLRIAINTTGFNINYLTFSVNATGTPAISAGQTVTDTINTPFSYQVVASNSPTGYTATGLPAGLTINTTTGLITGTPTAIGTSTVAVTATNGNGTANGSLSIIINPAPPAITSALTTSGMVGSLFSYSIIGSSSPTSYHATGLPAGLNLNTSTGAITGTPATKGVYNVTISATNTGGTGATQTLAIIVNPASHTRYLSFQPTRLANGTASLQWSVDSETAIQQYEVYRSTDSTNYIAIATVNLIINAYSATATIYDTSDISTAPGDMFYFVKATGTNGSIFYSDTVKVDKLPGLSIYPNPVVNDQVYIPFTSTTANAYTIQLVNEIGQVVYTTGPIAISGSTVYPLQLPKVRAGVYQLKLTDASGVRTIYKIAIQK